MRRFQLESKLHDYLANELDASARAEVEALLARDESARALLDEMRAADDALSLLRDRQAPEAPLEAIQRQIAAGVFAGRPEPELHAWGTRFYKRVAAAAVLTCGVSLGLLGHNVWSNGSTSVETPVSDRAPVVHDIRKLPEMGVDVDGNIVDTYEFLNRNRNNLATFTPTDSVTPSLEIDPFRRR
ncbi:MAG: hypothetical protein AAGD14_08550 [Planctomycetota bacterium]